MPVEFYIKIKRIGRRFVFTICDKTHDYMLDQIIIRIPSNLTAKSAINRFLNKRVNEFIIGVLGDMRYAVNS